MRQRALPPAFSASSCVRIWVVLSFLAAAAPGAGQATLRIGTIQFRRLDVFSPEEAARGWVYRAANSLHIETRRSVVERFLLFHEGDSYDPEKLAQTERNLRALPFIKLALVTAGPAHDGLVDVEVATQDTWTTEPGGALGSKGGVTTYGLFLVEKNLLGLGHQLSFRYDKGTERTTREFEYADPYLFGPYWNGHVLYAVNSDGKERTAEIERPFYAFETPWAVRALGDSLRQNETVYRGSFTFSKFQQDHREVLAQYGVALLASEARARRLNAGFDSIEDSFSPLVSRPDDLLPDERKFRYLFLQYDDAASDFVKLNYVNRDLRYEDFNLGLQVSALAAVSPAALGPDHTTERFRLSAARGWRLGSNGILLGQASWDSRLDDGLRNEIVSAEARYVRRFDTALLQTFVGRLHYDQGWRLDRDVQFFADGLTGLRAYRLHAFEGDKDLILNLEHRIFSGREILQLVAPGAAIFVDTGTAAPEGRPLRVADFKTDAGVGLRFGLARAPVNNVLRLDFAYAFNRDPRGRHGFLVSFSSSQAF